VGGLRGGRVRVVVLAAAAAVAVGLTALLVPALGALEDWTVDLRFATRPADPPAAIAVVAIDDVTFSDLEQQWPFPRVLHARMIDRLTRAGASLVVYDVQFTEPTTEAQDLALYRAVARSRRVVLATTEVDDHGATNVLGGDANVAAAHARVGASNLTSGRAEVLRRFPYEVSGLGSLAVVAAETLGRPVPRGRFPGGDALIDFRGPPGTVPTYSFSEVLTGRVPASAFRGKVVVVGAGAPSLQDMHPTPVAGDRPMAGPEVQANAIWTTLHGVPLRDAPPWSALLATLFLAIAAPIAALRVRAAVAAPLCAGVALAYAALAVGAFHLGLVLAVAAPLLAAAAGAIGAVGGGYLVERQERLATAGLNELLEARVAERTAELRETQVELVRRLAMAAESREERIGNHIERVGRLCEALALACGFTPADAERIRLASALHDVGKIGLPDSVLLKDGPLDDDERETMMAHTTIAGGILGGSSAPLVRLAEEIALAHHERWDGGGYPVGLRAEEIPLPARICAICDVFDALASARPYKGAWPLEETLAEMRRQRGHHFDPDLLDRFTQAAPRLYDELGYAAAARASAITVS
jgi:CHASE2 domain-containing sensor protein